MRLALPLFLSLLVCHAQNDPAFLQSTSPRRIGLAGYWRLEEASGTRYDRSKNGNHLTSNNTVGQTTGVSANTGNCATFTAASSQYLSIAANSTFQMTNTSFTVTGWLMMTTTNTLYRFAGQYDSGANQRAWLLLFFLAGNPQFQFIVSSNGTATSSLVMTHSGTINPNTWHFFAAYYDGTKQAMSIDNGTVDTLTYSSGVSASTAALTLGTALNSGAVLNPLGGRLDEVGIWKRVLTAAEITFLYNAGSGTHFPWAHP